jgi:hypothetical protein
MTEIALALAMAFFSIMVLTMISMGVGAGQTAETTAAMLAPSRPEAAPAAKVEAGAEDLIVLYHAGRFRDRDLVPLDPSTITASGRVILALEPDLPMAEAITARSRIDVADLVVTVLDERWLQALKKVNDDGE